MEEAFTIATGAAQLFDIHYIEFPVIYVEQQRPAAKMTSVCRLFPINVPSFLYSALIFFFFSIIEYAMILKVSQPNRVAGCCVSEKTRILL